MLMQPQARQRHIDTVLNLARSQGVAGTAPPLIGRSWQRCMDDYGLDPSRPRQARIVTSQTLREHQDSVDELLAVARSAVEQLYTQVAGLGYVLLLTDHRGITVQYLGNDRQDQHLRQAGLYLGADWSEQYAGTCAVGTCIQEQQALTCHRTDHFDATHIQLTCTSAPIFDPAGQLMAVLDISALESPEDRSSQMFSLHLTQLYARLIEDAYFLRRYRRQPVIRCGPSRELVRVNGPCLFAVDDAGQVVAANTAARGLMPPGDRVAMTAVFECELEDLWRIPFEQDEQVRCFRLLDSGDACFAELILPPARLLSTGSADDRIASIEAVPELDQLAADDPVMRRTLGLAKRLRMRDVGLLILGETGTGKEVLARAIHQSGHRAKGAFVAVNCAAIPESLIESELFGYAPGAFTGARAKGMRGLIQQADGGTLFLDEIGDMPLPLQTRLLRVLAEGEILPVGADRPIRVDCRVIAATHQDLGKLIEAGQFRADLYYRLNAATLKLPALRQRVDRHYVIQRVLAELVEQGRLPQVRIRADAMTALLGYHWPGNVRELVNALAFAEATCDNGEITVADLPEDCFGASDGADLSSAPARVNRSPLEAALWAKHWNVSAVARQFQVSRPTVYRWMRQQGLVQPQRLSGTRGVDSVDN
ncbi:sigma-54-dependent Fis family transcriptional regulator [Marinobacter sp. CA1]|uniref:sigma-54-dependent Fis family transcriptional regulator n=1 Tax=Marinobacter sp. CA1 TaxID=2817656 RepID=UPI001E484B38|nr:sigma-54-dependent Fis family transcriptional regulator [Marinobacter sp. CA1]UDL06234.1 sigma-54-dependent Fis family transcriptional regulator [Marinobacter sp. CA1]